MKLKNSPPLKLKISIKNGEVVSQENSKNKKIVSGKIYETYLLQMGLLIIKISVPVVKIVTSLYFSISFKLLISKCRLSNF